KIVKSQRIAAEANVTIDLEGFASGVYHFSMQGSSFIKNGRVVIQ
ncbi:MAG: hypothetical protein ACI9FU_000985, partial [Granulosicoccus sp.]